LEMTRDTLGWSMTHQGEIGTHQGGPAPGTPREKASFGDPVPKIEPFGGRGPKLDPYFGHRPKNWIPCGGPGPRLDAFLEPGPQNGDCLASMPPMIQYNLSWRFPYSHI